MALTSHLSKHLGPVQRARQGQEGQNEPAQRRAGADFAHHLQTDTRRLGSRTELLSMYLLQ